MTALYGVPTRARIPSVPAPCQVLLQMLGGQQRVQPTPVSACPHAASVPGGEAVVVFLKARAGPCMDLEDVLGDPRQTRKDRDCCVPTETVWGGRGPGAWGWGGRVRSSWWMGAEPRSCPMKGFRKWTAVKAAREHECASCYGTLNTVKTVNSMLRISPQFKK